MVVERAYLRRVKPKFKLRKPAPPSAPTTASLSTSTSTTSTFTSTPEPVRFKVNIIVPATVDRLACFVAAGQPSPFYDVSEVPESLRAFIASGEESDPELDDSPQSLNYTLNTSYDIDSRGFRRSRVGREIINLQQQAETQAYWEVIHAAEKTAAATPRLESSLLDRADAPEQLLNGVGDNAESWQFICRMVAAMERSGIQSLVRPFHVGSDEGPNAFEFV
jgi:hypothetical protein